MQGLIGCAMKYVVLLFIILLQLVCCQYIISTIAGSGGTGSTSGSYSGDNGAATSATLNYPSGVALDASGRILQLLSAALVLSN